MTALDKAKLIASLEIFRGLPDFDVLGGERFILIAGLTGQAGLIEVASAVLDCEYALNEFKANAIRGIEGYLADETDMESVKLVSEVLMLMPMIKHILKMRKAYKEKLRGMIAEIEASAIGDLWKIPHTVH